MPSFHLKAGSAHKGASSHQAVLDSLRLRKDILKKYDMDIMCMIGRMGGAATFNGVGRAALVVENLVRRHRAVEPVLAALTADPLPLKIQTDAVKPSLLQRLFDGLFVPVGSRVMPDNKKHRLKPVLEAFAPCVLGIACCWAAL